MAKKFKVKTNGTSIDHTQLPPAAIEYFKHLGLGTVEFLYAALQKNPEEFNILFTKNPQYGTLQGAIIALSSLLDESTKEEIDEEVRNKA